MIIGTIFSITPAFVYWLAGILAINDDPSAPTIGQIVAFTTLQSRLFFPLGPLLNVQVEIQGSLALFDRIFEYLEMDPEIVDAPDAVALDPRHGRRRRPASATSGSAIPPAAPGRPCGRPGEARRARPASSTSTAWSRRRPRARDPLDIRARCRRSRRRLCPRGPRLRGQAGPARRAGRAVRRRQDHHDLPDPAAVRRRRGLGRDRRPRRPRRSRSRHSARRSAS